MNIIKCLRLLLLCFLLAPVLGFAQTPETQKYKAKLLNDTIVHRSAPKPEPVIDFPNLNKVAYYRDKKSLKKIRKYEKRKEFKKTRPILENYVNNFGVENFYKDTYLLWRLAQLLEREGQEEKAKAYYRLALKHHRTDIRNIKLYYDSLEQLNKDYYVPLEFYYEMVEYRKSISAFKPPKGVYLNMGYEINSPMADYGPTINTDAERFIFTSKRNIRGLNDRVDEDLYYSANVGGYWEPAKSFGKPINSPYNEGSATLSRDGKTLYFARCYAPDGMGNCDLYMATMITDSTWGNIQNLGVNVNSEAWDSQPSLSKNEDTLYFASDRLGGFGLSDIYFTYKLKNGKWAPAQNIGPVVNTRESEVSPFFHPEYEVLYFSSRGQLYNFGDFDIYKTYRVNGRWQEPRNIGPLVNGKGSEYYFTIDGESKNLYYARSEANDIKNLDLYSFPLPMEAHPLAVTHIEGLLVDSTTNKPLQGIVSIIDLDNGIEVASKYIREDGSFDFDLIDKSRYMMLIQSPDYFTVEKEINLQQDTLIQIMTRLIDYKVPLVFQNIEFDENKADIKENMEPVLDRIVIFMVDHPEFKLKIAGHTDSAGDFDFNMDLSQRRADAIKKYIEQKGKLAEGRISAWGYGSTEPLKEEITEADRRINRRVEFKLLKPEDEKPKNLSDWE